MQLDHVTWQGPSIDDLDVLSRLPDDLRVLLEQLNGFIQFGGGFHLRGACLEPSWHSLQIAWDSPDAFHRHYRSIRESDIPFAQDAVGDQFLLRDEIVVKLSAECDECESLGIGLFDFVQSVQNDPINRLALQPLQNYWECGGKLDPGQLLSVMPPFVVEAGDVTHSYRAIGAQDRMRFLFDLARQIRDLPDGTSIQFKVDD